jgi:hypothetical protein
MNVAEGRCFCDQCEDKARTTYQLMGTCKNCGTSEILMVFAVGDPERALNCPVCDAWGTVRSDRLATDSELLTEGLIYAQTRP